MTVPSPKIEASRFIVNVVTEPFEHIWHNGDMWPVTWGGDGNVYAASGDTYDPQTSTISPMAMFVAKGTPGVDLTFESVCRLPVDPALYCRGFCVDPNYGIKPAGVLTIDGIMYMSVQNINYGDNPHFNRQHNLNGWIITSDDYGKTWDVDASFQTFFTGRMASAHFVQFGQGYAGARDEYVYALFPCGLDGQGSWCNNDEILIGRVLRDQILDRRAWEFLVSLEGNLPCWDHDDRGAIPVFSYPGFTGENHVSYNAGLGRYIMGNYAFYDGNGRPRAYHQNPQPPMGTCISQLTLYEAPEPWGPWRLFWQVDDWGKTNYQPAFPTKWMSADGKEMVMVSSGREEHYKFAMQRLHLEIDESYADGPK